MHGRVRYRRLWRLPRRIRGRRDPSVWAICAELRTELLEADSRRSVSGASCLTAFCPEGTRAIGGGGSWPDDSQVCLSEPTDDGDWRICIIPGTDGLWNVQAYCAAVGETRLADVSADTFGVANCDEVGGFLVGGGGSADTQLSSSSPDFRASADLVQWGALAVTGELDRVRALCAGPYATE